MCVTAVFQSQYSYYSLQVHWAGEEVELDPKEPGKLVTDSNKYVHEEKLYSM